MSGYQSGINVPATLDVSSTLPTLLRACANNYADQALLIFDDECLSYGQAIDKSAVLAMQLVELGVAKGARIGLLFPNNSKFVITWLAIVRIGAVAVPISTLATPRELQRIVRHADLYMLIAADNYLKADLTQRIQDALGLQAAQSPFRINGAPNLRHIWIWGKAVPAWADPVELEPLSAAKAEFLGAIENRVCPADVISIIYTSGSTAEPKGVIHSHGVFLRQSKSLANQYPFIAGDKVFIVMPFFWVGGLVCGLLTNMQVGSTVICSSRSSSRLLDLLEDLKPPYMLMWPNIARALGSDPSFASRDFSFLKSGLLLEFLSPEQRSNNPIFIGNSLGMTETAGPHTTILTTPVVGHEDSMGPPVAAMEHRIVNSATGTVITDGQVGELEVRGQHLMLGYVGRERNQTFDRDGWFRTGDLCEWRQGHLYFKGRSDDTIKTAGANVAPGEVEEVLLEIEGIEQAIVVGVEDNIRGSIVGAVLVVTIGRAFSVAAVIEYAKANLAAYKVPKVVLMVGQAELPLTATGKIRRQALAEMLAAERSRLGDENKQSSFGGLL